MNHEPETERDSEPTALELIERDTYSRGRFLKMVGGVGAAAALSTLIAACGSEDDGDGNGGTGTDTNDDQDSEKKSDDKKDSGSTDLEIVNYALTLEYLEAAFYDAVVDSGLFKGAELATIKTFGEHEQAHVEALTATAKALGTPAEAPKATFPLEDRMSVLELAATVENLGAAAYLGQAGRIKDPEILAAALSIHSVEARHASALNRLLGKSATPDGAFAAPATMEQVLEAVQPFITS